MAQFHNIIYQYILEAYNKITFPKKYLKNSFFKSEVIGKKTCDLLYVWYALMLPWGIEVKSQHFTHFGEYINLYFNSHLKYLGGTIAFWSSLGFAIKPWHFSRSADSFTLVSWTSRSYKSIIYKIAYQGAKKSIILHSKVFLQQTNVINCVESHKRDFINIVCLHNVSLNCLYGSWQLLISWEYNAVNNTEVGNKTCLSCIYQNMAWSP